MDLIQVNNELKPKDLEAKLRDELKKGLPINWELFWQIEKLGVPNNPYYEKVVDLLLQLNIFSLKQDGNIVIRFPDTTSSSIGNPRHYSFKNVEHGYNPLFFTRDQDAIAYIRAGEEINDLVKGYQSQRVSII